nr:uncharacterized protein LOC115254624 [Aedes albopictus]
MRFLKTVAVFLPLWLLTITVSSEINQPEIQLHPATPRRGRFLGLLGLLTGLSLVDSFEDSDTRIRPPAGIVKINIGRPLMESLYQYAYNPYYYGAVPTINIKIPIRPDGALDGGGFGGVGFGGLGGTAVAGVGVIGGHPGQFGSHATTNLIEPRPTFSDPGESSSAESTEEAPKKPKHVKKLKRSKISSSRIIRSTSRSEISDDQTVGEQNPMEVTTPSIIIPTPNQELNDQPTEEPLILHATAIPVIEDTSITTLGPFLSAPAADVPQPIPQSYFAQADSLQDTSEISLTTSDPPGGIDPFRASRVDRWQDYYAIGPDKFRPISSA